MHRVTKAACLVLLFSGFAISAQAVAQNASIRLSAVRQIRKGVDAWPMIVSPKNDAEKRINRYLTGLNTKLDHSLRDCHANYEGAFGKNYKVPEGDEGAESWTQDIKVTMLGPTFLSLLANTGFYCGGAHPYGFTSVVAFALDTGEPVDPLKWFTPGSNVSYADVDEPAPPIEKSISAPDLVPTYKELTKHECDDLYKESQPFLIWPDASTGQVMIEADALPGCCEACGYEVGIALDQARRLGFADDFLSSIQQAHNRFAAAARH